MTEKRETTCASLEAHESALRSMIAGQADVYAEQQAAGGPTERALAELRSLYNEYMDVAAIRAMLEAQA